MKDFIEVKDLHFQYTKAEQAINGISFNIKKGEFVAIVGHNGSGKSTLAKLLVGLLPFDIGSISIDGVSINEDNIDDVRKKIGIVFQNPDNQFVGVTVKDDIAFGLENRQIKKEEMIKRINYYSSLVSMNDKLDRNPLELSGGEKQRVAIAGVLACEPDLIIFDEATSMLDPLGVVEINNLINSLKKDKTIITITHNLNEIVNADHVIVMNEGKIILEGTPKEIIKDTEKLAKASLVVPDSIKLLDIVRNSKLKNKEEVEEKLCQLIFPK